MADLELVEGEKGDPYNISVVDKDGNFIDLTAKGITTISLLFADEDDYKIVLKTITGLTIGGANNDIAIWSIVAGDVIGAGNYVAMLTLTDGGGLVRKNRPPMTVHIQEGIGT